MSDEFVSTSPLTFTPPVQGVCPKHGEVTEALTVFMAGASQGKYCLHCWAEWVSQHVPKLQPVQASGE